MLIADGGRLAVAWQYGRVVGQMEELATDAVAQLIVTAAFKIGATYAAAKECIARENPAFKLGI